MAKDKGNTGHKKKPMPKGKKKMPRKKKPPVKVKGKTRYV